MAFGKWRKSARDTGPGGGVRGVIRRGLAETTGRLPSERIAKRRVVEGRNPYDQSRRDLKKPVKVNVRRQEQETPSPYEGAGNPYNSAVEVPSKKKLDWDDVPFDTRHKG